MWSIFAVGLFDAQQGVAYTGEIRFLGIQILGIVSFSIWSLTLSFIFFYFLKQNDRLRIDPLYETIGMDFIRHLKQSKYKNKFIDLHLFNEKNLL